MHFKFYSTSNKSNYWRKINQLAITTTHEKIRITNGWLIIRTRFMKQRILVNVPRYWSYRLLCFSWIVQKAKKWWFVLPFLLIPREMPFPTSSSSSSSSMPVVARRRSGRGPIRSVGVQLVHEVINGLKCPDGIAHAGTIHMRDTNCLSDLSKFTDNSGLESECKEK